MSDLTHEDFQPGDLVKFDSGNCHGWDLYQHKNLSTTYGNLTFFVEKISFENEKYYVKINPLCKKIWESGGGFPANNLVKL